MGECLACPSSIAGVAAELRGQGTEHWLINTEARGPSEGRKEAPSYWPLMPVTIEMVGMRRLHPHSIILPHYRMYVEHRCAPSKCLMVGEFGPCQLSAPVIRPWITITQEVMQIRPGFVLRNV